MRWLILFLLAPMLLFSQDLGLLEPLRVVDTPTAGTLMRGSFRTEIDETYTFQTKLSCRCR